MAKLKAIDYNYASTPDKSSDYKILYRRAKSRDIVEGTARFNVRGTKNAPKGWSNITNDYTKRTVNDTYDTRDSKSYSPVVVAWVAL